MERGRVASILIPIVHVDVAVITTGRRWVFSVRVCSSCFLCVCVCRPLCHARVLCASVLVACSSSCFLPLLVFGVCVCSRGAPSRKSQLFPISRSVGQISPPFLSLTHYSANKKRIVFLSHIFWGDDSLVVEVITRKCLQSNGYNSRKPGPETLLTERWNRRGDTDSE